MRTLLLVEDDPVLSKSVALNLELEKWHTLHASSLEQAFALEASHKLDGVILDLGLPDGSGLSFLKAIRERGSRIPVLILTAQTDEDSVVKGLELGATDYIKKPFSMRELIARVRNSLYEPNQSEDKLRFGPLLILRASRTAHVGDIALDLNRRELDILIHLAERGGQVVTRENLLLRLDSDGEIFDRTIDSHISHLRARFKKAGVTSLMITSVYGIGYRLEERHI